MITWTYKLERHLKSGTINFKLSIYMTSQLHKSKGHAYLAIPQWMYCQQEQFYYIVSQSHQLEVKEVKLSNCVHEFLMKL
jgi:hypothetical protein